MAPKNNCPLMVRLFRPCYVARLQLGRKKREEEKMAFYNAPVRRNTQVIFYDLARQLDKLFRD